MPEVKAPKKLIEVALPLDDINREAAREKSIRHGHPSTLHLWWARRPLAAARAVLFAQLVNDPGGERGYKAGKTKAQADAEREELFKILRELVLWENTNNESVLRQARKAINDSWRETCEMNKGLTGFDPTQMPAFHDPFAGGGAIPLEAQRLGLEAHASDLNPVAVLINKAMIEIPPKFAGRVPVGPISDDEKLCKLYEDWSGAQGLAEDVRRYGHWMRDEAFKRVGHLYPRVEITKDVAEGRPDLKQFIGQKFTVIAWLWTRTVKSPNPAFSHVYVPLVSSFFLSSKPGKEAWVEPIIDGDNYHFQIRIGGRPEIIETVNRKGGVCLLSSAPMPFTYIREEAKMGRMGQKLMAIVVEGPKGRLFLPPIQEMENIAQSAHSERYTEAEISHWPGRTNVVEYGLTKFLDLFTPRQLLALTTFSDLVQEAQTKATVDSISAGWKDDKIKLMEGGTGATAYGEAIAVFLGMGVSRLSDICNSLCRWEVTKTQVRNLFGRQAIPMIWDFAENNVFSEAAGDYKTSLGNLIKVLKTLGNSPDQTGFAIQCDAQSQSLSVNKLISTDPPYYDNIGYAGLSDFFYVWLRRTLKGIYPSLFSTLVVPKAEELVATPHRHGGKLAAERFFLDGMTQAIHNLALQAHPAFPVTIYYAFKQSETSDSEGTSSTGWETFLEAILKAGFAITGTWPMRTELGNRMIGSGANALASSIVLVCRKRPESAETISRKQFQRELRTELPESLETMIGGKEGYTPIAPVDLAQASIGPGMAIFSKYVAVLNQDGSSMSVHEALVLINRQITEYLSPESGSFDADTLFCSSWFDQYEWKDGPFGEANTLAQAKGTVVESLKLAGVIESGGGKVRLLKWNEYPWDWDPSKDTRIPAWEACHQLIRALNQGGEVTAGLLLSRIPQLGEQIRQLAYHLYTLCERKKWAEDARAYNELITSWHRILEASLDVGHKGTQLALELDN